MYFLILNIYHYVLIIVSSSDGSLCKYLNKGAWVIILKIALSRLVFSDFVEILFAFVKCNIEYAYDIYFPIQS